MSEDRTPPQDNAAEQAVLGAMLLSKDAIAEVVEVVQGTDFYRPAHETIYDVVVELFATGEPVDPITVGEALNKAGELTRVGGAPYLHTLSASVPVVVNARHWAQQVAEKAVLRRIIDAGRKMQQEAYQAEDDALTVLVHAEENLAQAAPRRVAEDYRVIGETVTETLDEIEALDGRDPDLAYGIPTGFIDLDALLGGLHPGQMVVVAGRPATGKSTLAVDIMRSASIHNGYTSCMFSLEMTRHELTTRVLSAEAKVSLQKLRAGGLAEDDWGRIAGALERVSNAPLFIDDSPNLTMTEIRAKARRLAHEADLKLIAIDYMQLMSSGKKVESRQLEVSEFSRQIKLLAKELEVPVIALSQLNRGVEQRSTKRPMLSDLRESGAIEQDADVVILVHRDDLYEQESSRPGEADLIVAKHRNGPTRDVTVAFQGHYSRFVDMAPG